ncbi:MAG: homoserine O-acetyltransferase/O-succinyltransferase [Gemmatimonadales bacterium]|nr:homoserine O-acetyltransferase/O-succinyltransferase [Gemmatimonadales bacterium]
MTAIVNTGWPTRDFTIGELTTADGQVLTDLRLRYRVIGDVRAAAQNGWILVFHALTGSADVEAWWGPLVGPGRALDTSRHAIVSANLLGGCHGSTGPTEWKAERGGRFPELTPVDLARAHIPLLEHLGIRRLALATGGSLGGMVALQWGRVTSVPTDRLVVFAAPAAASPQAIGWNAVQRMSIEADPAWSGGDYAAGQGPAAGLAAARALAMITYRSAAEFQARFGRLSSRSEGMFDVEHYLRRQGDKLVARFDAASYVALMRSMDLQDVGDLATAAHETARKVERVIGVGIDSDILYPASEVRDWVAAYQAAGGRAEYREIASLYGHDAFLIEWDQVEGILRG